ncbi:hypothetical protein HPB49_014539 [Dermacentor silvarum]|uniref:Uncharacterized protein n=1 Tax=Dermacentor silvarum TaxID=543639 RepID=A0ACB8CXM2_DERSI|nr:hypothetical protein HPB49_014539 [Dermacentor silvarum]
MKLQNKLDELLDVGRLNEVHEMMVACEVLPDPAEIVRHKSDSRITYYVSGYVARKMLKKTKCNECSRLLLHTQDSSLLPAESCLTRYTDRGGLLYPSESLTDLVKAMEDAFTYCFSFNKLKTGHMMDLISCLSVKRLNTVGCEQHKVEVTNQIIRFFTLTRMHFLVAGEKASNQKKKEKIEFLQMRRTT